MKEKRGYIKMLRRSPAYLAWLFIFVGMLVLSAADTQPPTAFRSDPINWDAIAAMASVAGGLALLNWFTIRQAVGSAVLKAELSTRNELEKYVTLDLCKTKHWDTERRVEILEEQMRVGRGQHLTDQKEDNRRIDALEGRT